MNDNDDSDDADDITSGGTLRDPAKEMVYPQSASCVGSAAKGAVIGQLGSQRRSDGAGRRE